MKLHKNNDHVITQYETMKEYDKIINADSLHGRSDSSRTGNEDFTGTSSFEESEELRQYGDKVSHDSVIEIKSSTDKAFMEFVGTKVKNFNDVKGFQPIVPNAIIGLPLSMINQKRVPKKTKIIRIYCNMGTQAGTSTEEIALRGALILSAIDTLERSGYRVEVFTGCVTWACIHEKVVGHITRLKQATQPLNTLKLAYYIANPSFLRRTEFAILENEKDLPDITHDGYGQNMKHDKQKKSILHILGENTLYYDNQLNIRKNDMEHNVNVLVEFLGGALVHDKNR